MKDLISIIIPVYNSENTLEKCLESLLNQTYSNIQIILVDDGSKDSSSKICEEFSKKDKRIIFVSKENEGVSKARNVGLELATGKYIAFVDSDDYVEENMIETLYKLLTNNNVDCVKANYDIILKEKNISNNEIKIDRLYKKEEINEFVKILVSEKQKSFLWLLLVKKECIKENFNEELFLYEDMNFYLDLLENINNLYVSSKVLYHYRVDKKSLSRNADKAYKSIENLLKANEILSLKLNEESKKVLNTRIVNSIINYYYSIYSINNNIKEIIKSFENSNQINLENYDENILTKKEKIFNSSLINKKYFKFYILCKCKNILNKLRGING